MNMVRKSYSQSFKRAVVNEIENGIGKADIRLWLEEYGRFRPKRDIVEVVMKSEKERIAELEKALAEAHLKNRAYEEVIKIADKKYKTDLKKLLAPGCASPQRRRVHS